MEKHSRKDRKSMTNASDKDYVVVTVVDDKAEAQEYKSLLKSNEIPVLLKEQDEGSMTIMVPEEYLDEAHVLIQEQDSYDEFYDVGMDEDDGEELDDDILEEEEEEY